MFSNSADSYSSASSSIYPSPPRVPTATITCVTRGHTLSTRAAAATLFNVSLVAHGLSCLMGVNVALCVGVLVADAAADAGREGVESLGRM